jgi:hypothetical protein
VRSVEPERVFPPRNPQKETGPFGRITHDVLATQNHRDSCITSYPAIIHMEKAVMEVEETVKGHRKQGHVVDSATKNRNGDAQPELGAHGTAGGSEWKACRCHGWGVRSAGVDANHIVPNSSRSENITEPFGRAAVFSITSGTTIEHSVTIFLTSRHDKSTLLGVCPTTHNHDGKQKLFPNGRSNLRCVISRQHDHELLVSVLSSGHRRGGEER